MTMTRTMTMTLTLTTMMMMMMMMMTGRGWETVPWPALSSVLLPPRSVSASLSFSYDYTHSELYCANNV